MNVAALSTSLPSFLRRHKLVQFLLKVYPEARYQSITFNEGAKAFVDLAEPAPRECMLKQAFEPEFFNIAAPFLANGGVYFDIGANFGLCSMGLVATPGGRQTSYHLFEANERLCGLLKKSAELHPGVDVRLNYCALSDQPGQSHLSVNEDDAGNSFVSESGGVVVDNLVLDDYIAEQGITKINFTKMDIEGSEPRALRGAVKSLKAGIFDVIYLEVSTHTLTRMGFSVDDCLKPMTDNGFELFYCKEEDFISGKAKAEETFYLDLPGGKVKLAPMHAFPSPHHTDLMAIHRSSGLLSKRSSK